MLGERVGREVECIFPSTTDGKPALGSAETGAARGPERKRSASYISTGPVAQFIPMTSGFIASSVHSAAPISVPSSIRPVSSMVTCTWIGTSRPTWPIARRHAWIAAFAWSTS